MMDEPLRLKKKKGTNEYRVKSGKRIFVTDQGTETTIFRLPKPTKRTKVSGSTP